MNNIKLMTCGNAKIDKSVLLFSIPPIKTCLNCKDCAKNCYANKAYRLYPTVKAAWDRNLEISKDSKLFIELISQQIETSKKAYVRVHQSGDFYSVEYINAWYEIAKKHSGVMFWTYTKVFNYSPEFNEALKRLNELDNFNIVESLPLDKINFGDDNYIQELKQEISDTLQADAFICPCGRDDSIKCGVNCHACAHCKYVLFKKH